MARIGRHRHKKPTISDFEAFAIFLLATAEDEDDEFIAITWLTWHFKNGVHINLTNVMAVEAHITDQSQRTSSG